MCDSICQMTLRSSVMGFHKELDTHFTFTCV